MKRTIGTPVPDADHGALVHVCRTVADLFSANHVSVWSYQPPAAGSKTGLVGFCAGATWDGRELNPGHRWSSVPITDIPTFASCITQNRPVACDDPKKASTRQGELASALGSVSFDCEPINSNTRPVGIVMVDPPRTLETERAILLPVILEEAAFIMAKLEMGHYREEARFLLSLLGRATAQRSMDHVLGTVCEETARRLGARHATVFLCDADDTGISLDAGAARRYVPRMSKRANGTRDLKAWKDFDLVEPEIAGHILAWATAENPLEAHATGWWSDAFGATTLLGAPVVVAGTPAGAFVVDSATPRESTEAESYLVAEVSRMLGWLIEWALYSEGTGEINLPATPATSRLLLGSAVEEQRTTDDIVTAVCTAAAEMFGTEVSVPVATGQQGATGYAALSVVRDSAATGQPSCTADIWGATSVAASEAPVLRSAISIPLGTGGRPWFVVVAGHLSTARTWTTEDLQRAKRLALEGSLRLEMARLDRVDRHQVRSIAQQLLRDPLTGLPNTVLLVDRIEQAINRARRDKAPLALLCLDIERLRDVNDTLGRDRGDMLLAQAGARLSESLRISDVVARIGDDEFAVLLTTSATPEGTRIVGEKMLRVMALPFNVDGEMVMVNSKIGVALFPDHGDDPTILMDAAIEALRQAAATPRHGPPPGPAAGPPAGPPLGSPAEVAPLAAGGTDSSAPLLAAGAATLSDPDAVVADGVAAMAFGTEQSAAPAPVPVDAGADTDSVEYVAAGAAPYPGFDANGNGNGNGIGTAAGAHDEPAYDESRSDIAGGAHADPMAASALYPNTPPPHAMIRELPDAIRGGQLVLHYLPMVNLTDGDVLSMEALVRWEHPAHGMISPGAFLPLIEETEVGWDLTRWVIDTALDQCAEWFKQGIAVAVSVNVSRYDVTQAPLIDTVCDALARTKLLGRHLTLEVPERLFMDEMVKGSSAIVILRSNGVRISIDDCGSGQVSPVYLARLPVDEIKIDSSLVTTGDPDDLALLRSIVQLGHEFKIEVTAEAVEKYNDAGSLSEIGIDHIQGYHVTGPLRAERVVGWVNEFRSRSGRSSSVVWTG